MIGHEAQKAKKLTVLDVARTQLDGAFLTQFEAFLTFCDNEKIRLPWKSINGFKMTYKGKNIGGLTLGAGGWLDNNVGKRNYLLLHINTTDRHDYDAYLHNQPQLITDLFMEQISHKCTHCRPTCGCSKVSGRTIHVANTSHENVCMNAIGYKFYASGDGMQTLTMCTPRAVYPPEDVRKVPLDTVKALMLARKDYITSHL